jgi:hypothetical protein
VTHRAITSPDDHGWIGSHLHPYPYPFRGTNDATRRSARGNRGPRGGPPRRERGIASPVGNSTFREPGRPDVESLVGLEMVGERPEELVGDDAAL